MNAAQKESPHASPERDARVAEALRENLRKRKQQQQNRAAQNNLNKDK